MRRRDAGLRPWFGLAPRPRSAERLGGAWWL